ncbi:putative methyltransferase [Candidatus Moduliflexus flocculans]|uniref:Putative methyltransferase n=1 Tax=Candidatus Moduliflexus flocculans TaxID=1499966 RepID=A0A081BMV7_9BACT|nr:putative methyltransferase [Candidatus Moduliflexus flocculans]
MLNRTFLKQQIKQHIPTKVLWPILRWRRQPVTPANWLNLRQLTPMSRSFGFDRGTPICRHYIAQFLSYHAQDIHGCVLEIADANYTNQFGGKRVVKSDVLHVTGDNPNATIVGNLATGEGIPHNAFDCIILTQTLPFIYDLRAAVRHLHAALRPGGVVLATASGISPISRYDMERWGDFWRLTDASAKKLFEESFLPEHIQVTTYGNVLSAVAYLHGLAAEELTWTELDACDPDYQVIIAIRAEKS